MSLPYFNIAIYTILSCSILAATSSVAQNKLKNTDTLTFTEKQQLEVAEKHSFFGYCQLADSFSRLGDSANASKWLLKADPYYMLFQRQTPQSIGDFLSKNFKLTAPAKLSYIQTFDTLYNKPKTEAYNKFKQMFDEDQQVRNILDKAADSFTYSKTGERMRYTDSVHFDYLYHYVLQNGWPKLCDGSLYAHLLAIHDHEHYDLYIPQLKKAILDGNGLTSALDLILYWKANDNSYKSLKKVLDTSRKRVFDVSSMINDQLPGSMQRIEKEVKAHCPVKIVLTYECRQHKDYIGWVNKMMAASHRKNSVFVIQQLFDDLHIYCSKSIHEGIWDVWYLPSDVTKMKLYVLY